MTWKANANLKKTGEKAIPGAAKRCQKQLNEEIEVGRATHGKKSLKKNDDDERSSALAK